MTGYFVGEGNYLMHHGVLGMKWGVRRYQNKDGSLTAAGRKRYYTKNKNGEYTLSKKGKNFNERQSHNSELSAQAAYRDFLDPEGRKLMEEYRDSKDEKLRDAIVDRIINFEKTWERKEFNSTFKQLPESYTDKKVNDLKMKEVKHIEYVVNSALDIIEKGGYRLIDGQGVYH